MNVPLLSKGSFTVSFLLWILAILNWRRHWSSPEALSFSLRYGLWKISRKMIPSSCVWADVVQTLQSKNWPRTYLNWTRIDRSLLSFWTKSWFEWMGKWRFARSFTGLRWQHEQGHRTEALFESSICGAIHPHSSNHVAPGHCDEGRPPWMSPKRRLRTRILPS